MIADTDRVSDERDPPRRVWRVTPLGGSPRVPGWVVGAMVHKALARWVYPANPGFYDWMLAVAQEYGVTGTPALQYAVRHASEILERFQSSELYEHICCAEVRLFEVPYSLINAAGEVEYGLVDALYLYENQWHLVEYKTDFVRSLDDINTLLEQKDYVQQMTRYVNAVTKLIKKRPFPNLCFVNAGGTVLSITNRW
jgi:ATP-dependent exoDNAse (exonuclease V) beta subunit